MTNRFERAADEIEGSYERGEMSAAEYRAALRDLRGEMREAAQEAADGAVLIPFERGNSFFRPV